MYDVMVIGAAPAGLAAAVATLRQGLTTLLIAPDLSGKAAYQLRLPWLHQPERITGEGTVEQLRQQILTASLITRRQDNVEQVFRNDGAFHAITDDGGAFAARALIVASGVTPHGLGVTGEQRLKGLASRTPPPLLLHGDRRLDQLDERQLPRVF